MAAFTSSEIGLERSAKILVAVSGGPDSSALLVSLWLAATVGLLPMPIGVAHFHHGLRGADADADAAFTATLATTKMQLPCVIGLGCVATASRKSPNDAARQARYAFLIEAARDLGADTIATAHTLDDQAETVLGRVLRGTGVAGLGGIPAARELEVGITVVRPLLSQRRSAVEQFCRAQGIAARHDPSNDKDRYARSRLRKIMPALADQFNPRLAHALSELAKQAAQDTDLLQSYADRLWTDAVRIDCGSVAVDIAALQEAHPALRSRVLLRAIRTAATKDAIGEAATAAFVTALEKMISGGARETHLPGGLRATIAGMTVTLQRHSPAPTPEPFSASLSVPGGASVLSLELTVSARERMPEEAPIRERYSMAVDIAYNASESQTAPFLVRSTAPGDRISPLGMDGRSRAVRDILAERRVTRSERATYPVVIDARSKEIIWVVGVVQSESTRVNPETPTVVRLSAIWNKEHE